VAVGFARANGPRVPAEGAVAPLKVTPPILDVLLVSVKGTEAQVHGDAGGRVLAWGEGKDDPQKTSFGEQIVVRGMPGEMACLAHLVERQHGSRGVTLLRRPRGLTRRQ
jgi:hypothetical protein